MTNDALRAKVADANHQSRQRLLSGSGNPPNHQPLVAKPAGTSSAAARPPCAPPTDRRARLGHRHPPQLSSPGGCRTAVRCAYTTTFPRYSSASAEKPPPQVITRSSARPWPGPTVP